MKNTFKNSRLLDWRFDPLFHNLLKLCLKEDSNYKILKFYTTVTPNSNTYVLKLHPNQKLKPRKQDASYGGIGVQDFMEAL